MRGCLPSRRNRGHFGCDRLRRIGAPKHLFELIVLQPQFVSKLTPKPINFSVNAELFSTADVCESTRVNLVTTTVPIDLMLGPAFAAAVINEMARISSRHTAKLKLARDAASTIYQPDDRFKDLRWHSADTR